jgi:hypothetical protein
MPTVRFQPPRELKSEKTTCLPTSEFENSPVGIGVGVGVSVGVSVGVGVGVGVGVSVGVNG